MASGRDTVFIGHEHEVLAGELAPGPGDRRCLSPECLDTETDVARPRLPMVRVGDVKTFRHSIVPIPEGIDAANFSALIVGCETVLQLITAARYR